MSGYGAQHFTLSSEDFERQSVLKRRRQLSPPRSPSVGRHGTAANNSSSADGSIGFRRTRSKSKSRAPETTLRRLPSVQGQEFIALGRGDRPTASSTHRVSARSPSRGRATMTTSKESRSGRREVERESEPLPLARRTRSSSKARAVAMEAEPKPKPKSKSSSSHRERERGRSKSKSRKRSHSRRSSSRSSSSSPSRHRKSHSSSSRSSPKRHRRSKSKSVARNTKTSSSKRDEPSPKSAAASERAVDKELQDDIDYNEKKLKKAKRDLAELEEEQLELKRRMDKKNYEIMDVQIVLDGLHKRRELQQKFMRSDSFTVAATGTTSSSSAPVSTSRREPSPEREQSSRSSRQSKRPCIVDEDEDDEDTESDEDIVEIIERPDLEIKEEMRASTTRPKSSSSSTSRRSAADAPVQARGSSSSNSAPPPASVAPPQKVVDPKNDYFWGRVDVAKLLVQPRIRNVPDGSARKGRHLEFNPVQHDTFATSSDDGGMIMWKYAHHKQHLSKLVSFDPLSFRKDNQCAESIAWSPEGERMAIAFRDPVSSMGEFCVVRLHNLEISEGTGPQMLPKHHVKSKATTLHQRGISAIAWVPAGYADHHPSRGIVTTGPDHNVVLWEESKSQTDYKWRILHHEHRSDVRTICMHSQGSTIYTGGLDGLVIKYDMNAQRTHTVMERRRPHISKINSVLENPHNPNLLLISSVEQNEHNLLLHDIRERYTDKAMTLSWLRSSDSKSMSQYIVPRWSSGGFHVSCGSTSGLVNVWDVRVRGPKFPVVLPQQSIQVHQKQVLHAAWDPRHDAMFSVSNDRTIGLLTFR